MKKYISMLLCAVVLAMTGCASNEVNSGNAPAAGGDTTSATVSTTAEATTAAQTTLAVTTTTTTPDAPVESDEAVSDESGDSTASVPPAESTVISEPHIPEEVTEEDVPEIEPVFPEYVPMTSDDVMMELKYDGVLTTDTERFTVEFTYIGDAHSEYCFGCDYSLRKWNDNGWEDVEFSEFAAWNALGYLIGKDCPKNSITVSLSDDFYAQPLTAGTYLLVKPMCDGVVLEQSFEIKGTDGDLLIESESGSLTLVINEIAEDKLICSLAWPYPAVYEVMCDTSAYGDLCTGDTIEVQYAPMYKIEEFLFRLVAEDISMSDFELQEGVDYKPVIYLYPEEKTDVSVQLDYNGTLTVTEPEYRDGWNVTAYPDGRIVSDDTEYPYLFWEGEKAYSLDMSEGFCVKGVDTEDFLREKLAYLGLNEAETADFLEFWLPHMTGAPYNIIRFHGSDYTDNAVLDIQPHADTFIRVYMTVQPVGGYTDIPVQVLHEAPVRSGFTVVEWGGSVIR